MSRETATDPSAARVTDAANPQLVAIEALILKAITALEANFSTPVGYARALTSVADEYVQAGAWGKLLAAATVNETDWLEIICQSRHPFVRSLAVSYFELAFEHDWALKAAAAGSPEPKDIDTDALLARLRFDADGLVASSGQKYLATGAPVHLLKAVQAAEAQGGWRAALPWLARVFALNPADKDAAVSICNLLLQSSNFDLAQEFANRLARVNLHRNLAPLAEGAACIARGEYRRGIEVLRALRTERATDDVHREVVESRARLQIAEAYDRLGEYQKSFAEYAGLNRRSRSAKHDPRKFYEFVERRKRLKMPKLASERRNDVTMMLGFPRSGTTLLENALNAHPLVETFEEIPSHRAAVVYINRKVGPSGSDDSRAATTFNEARSRYYMELDMRRQKPGAAALVDKLPIQSCEATFMRRLFPERRYIFSIRHPFDVILSCFRQQFIPNSAMENFRTIAEAVRLYDFAMREWFSVFNLASPEVCYVRYEELVTDFESEIRRVLGFVGVEWDAGVLNFAAAADNRGHKTPSYEKVRKGLSIGIQTYWRNYKFVFEAEEAKPLYKWAEFFGYETK
jgi:tetratricopeptide (TPR) repeat protein